MRRRPTTLPTLASVAALLLTVSACGSSSSASEAGSAKPVVVTSFYPLQFVTSQIAAARSTSRY